jgi:hypothetical protein
MPATLSVLGIAMLGTAWLARARDRRAGKPMPTG